MNGIFNGKTVAFVGQAPILERKRLGPEIDKHDIVYRTNIFPIRNEADYGKKCNVISILPRFNEIIKTVDVKNLILFDEAAEIRFNQSKYIVTKDERKQIAAWALDEHNLDIISPTAGLVAYWLAMKFGAASVKFYGITGYQNKSGEVADHINEKHYTDSVYEWTGTPRNSVTADMKNYKFHNFTNQNDLFRILLRQELIQMDKYSLEYFKPTP